MPSIGSLNYIAEFITSEVTLVRREREWDNMYIIVYAYVWTRERPRGGEFMVESKSKKKSV